MKPRICSSGPESIRRCRPHLPSRARPPVIASARRVGPGGAAGGQSRGGDRQGDRRGPDRSLPGRPRPEDSPGARCRFRRPSADPLAPRRDAPGDRSAGRVRTSAHAAVRGARRRRSRHPRYGSRIDRRPAPLVRSCAFQAISSRGLAPAPRGGCPRSAARDVAVHGRPAVHPREPDRPRGVLPDDRPPLLRRGRPAS